MMNKFELCNYNNHNSEKKDLRFSENDRATHNFFLPSKRGNESKASSFNITAKWKTLKLHMFCCHYIPCICL